MWDADGKEIPKGKERVEPGTPEYAKFEEEYLEFLNKKMVVIGEFDPIPISDFNGATVTPVDMMILERFFKEPEKAPVLVLKE